MPKLTQLPTHNKKNSYSFSRFRYKRKWLWIIIIILLFLFFNRSSSIKDQSTQLGNDSHLLEVRLPSPPSEHFKELTIARETKLTPVDRRIPKIVHFVYGLRDPEPTLDLIHYIAIKSAHDTLKPEKIMFHYHHLPVGENFERARPMLTLNKVPLVEKVFGRPVSHYAHRADVVRLQVLEEFGGIYLDLDLISLKPVDHLLNREFIMAQEGVGKVKMDQRLYILLTRI